MAKLNDKMLKTQALYGTVSPTEQQIQSLQVNQQAELERKIAECNAKGGFWDGRKCILNDSPLSVDLSLLNETKKPETTETPRAFPDKGTIESSTTKGGGSMVTTSDGKTYLANLSPEEIQAIAQGEQRKASIPPNASPIGTAQNTLDTQIRNRQLLEMAQNGLLTPQELQAIQSSNLDMGQALGAGLAGVIPTAGSLAAGGLAGVLGGAAAGAGVGAVAGMGLASIPLAIVGALAGGYLAAVRSNIKGQVSDKFASNNQALTTGQSFLRALITDNNRNPQNAPENIALFYKTLNLIDQAHAKTWKDSRKDLNKFLGEDGSQELAQFEIFDGYLRQYYVAQFENSLSNPNPNNILLAEEDLGVSDE